MESKLIQGVIVITQTEYTPEPYQQMFLFWAAIFFALFVNILASTFLPKIEGFVLLLDIAGFFAVLLPLVVLGEHQDPHEVFKQWMNRGGFPTQGLSFMVGLIGAYLICAGADGAIHVIDSTFKSLYLALTSECLDVRGDPECSDCRSLVDPYQHHHKWCSSDCDDGYDTHRGRRLELGSGIKPRIRLHRNIHQRHWVSHWSGFHGLRSSSHAAFLQRRSFGFMFSNDLGVCPRPRCARI